MNVDRRYFLVSTAGVSALAAGVGIASSSSAMGAARPDGQIITPDMAIDRLYRGNRRWVNRVSTRKTYAPPGQTPDAGQWPFAAIVSRSDSRVVPEDAFDVAGKNLFIVPNAGNVVDDVTLGSLEYAAVHTGISLIVVLGHSMCGAVGATQASIETDTLPGGSVDSIVELITPGIANLPAEHTLDEAVEANAMYQARRIEALSPTLAAKTRAATVGIVQASYDLVTRKVTFF